MYAPIAAAAVANGYHGQSHPALSRSSRFDEVARRSGNYRGQEPGPYPHQMQPAPLTQHQQAAYQSQQEHQQAVFHHHMRQQQAASVQAHGGAYWAPPLAPRLTAAAPRAAWPAEAHGFGPARVDPWGRHAPYHDAAQAHLTRSHQHWPSSQGQHHNDQGGFPRYAQPHQQLEHQLLLHHYLSKLQAQPDHHSAQQAHAYGSQFDQQQRYRQQSYYGGHGYGAAQSRPSAHSEPHWPQFTQPGRQSSLVAPDQLAAPHQDWRGQPVGPIQSRPGYTSNWGPAAAATWADNDWAGARRGYDSHAAHDARKWTGHGQADAAAGLTRQGAYNADLGHDTHQDHRFLQSSQAVPEDGAAGGWHRSGDDQTAPTFSMVSPAPPPSPTGLAPAGDERAATGEAPAPPSPATIDKSSVPIYEIGVELVSAVCKAVLGSVGRPYRSASSALPAVHNSRRQESLGAQNRASGRRQSSHNRIWSTSKVGSGLGMYDATGRCHADALTNQLAASGFDGRTVPQVKTQSSHSHLANSQMMSTLANSTEAISSGDSSEVSSEPGTPASSFGEVDKFYPKPMSFSASESAPAQVRSAINFSLDQSGIWEPKSQDVSGWATASPALARAHPTRKSDSYSQRPLGLSAVSPPHKSASFSAATTSMQDSMYEERADTSSDSSSLIADGPLTLMSPSWPWTTVGDDFYSLPVCHGRSQPTKVYAMMEDAYVFRSHLEASGASSPTMSTDIKTAFARFAHQVLSQTLLSPTAFMLGLLYILRIPSLVLDADGAVKDEARALFAEPPSAAPFKLFTLGMMMANKQLDDNTFTNRTWQEVTGIPLLDLNRMERFYLERCHFEINMPPEVWYAFLGRLRDRENERRAHVTLVNLGSPSGHSSSPSAPMSGFDGIVTPECSRRVSAILKTLLNGEESISPLLGSVGEPALALAADLLRSSDEARPPVLSTTLAASQRHSMAVADSNTSIYTVTSPKDDSVQQGDPRFSAPEADVFDDHSGPMRQRSYRPHSAAAAPHGPGSFEFSRSHSNPTALCT